MTQRGRRRGILANNARPRRIGSGSLTLSRSGEAKQSLRVRRQTHPRKTRVAREPVQQRIISLSGGHTREIAGGTALQKDKIAQVQNGNHEGTRRLAKALYRACSYVVS